MRIQRADEECIAAAFPGQSIDVQNDFKLAQVNPVQFDRLGRNRQARVPATAVDSIELLPELSYLAIQITERRYGHLGSLNATLSVRDIARQVPQCNSGLPDHLAGSRGPIAGDCFLLGGSELNESLQAIDYQVRMPGDFS